MRVLIVDDEIDICRLVCWIIQQAGVPCDSVHNVNEARKRIKENNYDLYLLDIKLPDGNGFDLVDPIKELNNNAEIVMISAFDDKKEHEIAGSMGIKRFISKPFTKNDILAVLSPENF